jgi:hypothetical protein
LTDSERIIVGAPISGELSPVPVVLIVYNRPDLAQKALEAIASANPSQVLIISDGPKTDNPQDAMLVGQVREVCSQERWSFPISINAAPTNLGLRKRIISGLDWVFSMHEAAIILEDDCAPNETFFSYADSVLRHYAQSDQLGIVSGNNFCGNSWESEFSYGFSTTARIWGWGTWRHVWQAFSGQDSIQFSWTPNEREEILNLISGGVRKRSMRAMMSAGENLNSWAIPFSVYLLRNGLVNVVPERNLVENVGFGERSTHTKFESFTAQIKAETIDTPLRHPSTIQHDEWIEHAESKHHMRQLLTFPLKHPFDVVGRLWRYAKARRNS